ncbi:internalin-A precursor [bacterium BMS3Bbin03]|nr:internalin-A precursor [bacterium BMS3Bbin03]
MNLKELYNKLNEEYSDENLNRITGKLIELYKSKNYGKIREIANKISKYVEIDEEKEAKCFSKLIVLYHPDKGELHRKAIKKHYSENNFESLTQYSHIFQLKNIENVTVTAIDEDIDYQPEYTWEDNKNEGYYFYDEDEIKPKEGSDTEEYEKSFYNEIKLRVYGDLTIDFPPYYLEDFEDFELAQSGIESLDGVEYCKHVVTFDLSNNKITDISELRTLDRLKELYIANNQIGYIDALSSLFELRILDLSNNRIDDISPLFELDNLEYVNIIDNPISISQIEKLKEKGIIVMH